MAPTSLMFVVSSLRRYLRQENKTRGGQEGGRQDSVWDPAPAPRDCCAMTHVDQAQGPRPCFPARAPAACRTRCCRASASASSRAPAPRPFCPSHTTCPGEKCGSIFCKACTSTQAHLYDAHAGELRSDLAQVCDQCHDKIVKAKHQQARHCAPLRLRPVSPCARLSRSRRRP